MILDIDSRECLYRYESHNVSNGVDQYDEPYEGHDVRIYLLKYPIIKRTPKGAWIELFLGKKKFVLLTARKKFATETKTEARKQFIFRKSKYLEILGQKINDTNVAIYKIENMRIEENEKRIRNDTRSIR